MSVLQVNSIKDASDTKTLATLSNSAVTLDSSVTGPQMQLVHLETQTVTSTSSLTFEGKLTSTYDTYMLLGSQIKPDTDNRRIGLQFGVGSAGSVTYRTSEYYAQVQKIESGSYGSVIDEDSVSDAVIAGYGNQGSGSAEYSFTQVYLFNTQNSGVRSMGSVSAGGYKYNSEFVYSTGGFTHTSAEIHTAIKILFGTQTYSLSDTGQGKFSLYGIKNG